MIPGVSDAQSQRRSDYSPQRPPRGRLRTDVLFGHRATTLEHNRPGNTRLPWAYQTIWFDTRPLARVRARGSYSVMGTALTGSRMAVS
jgi:hypothetical protein